MVKSKMFKVCVMSLSLLFGGASVPSHARAETAQDIYPMGPKMPLGLYGLTKWTRNTVAGSGWNLSQYYQYDSKLPQECEKSGLAFTSNLKAIKRWTGLKVPQSTSRVLKQVNELKKSNNNAWWELPEEIRPFYKNEIDTLKFYSDITRANDPMKRPRYMYIPSQYNEDVIAGLVPYLDIVPVSLYRYGYRNAPWIRWRIESALEGIKRGGAKEGKDYLNGEKTVIAVLELFRQYRKQALPSPQEAYHDYWQALISGAKGIMVFSHSRIKDDARLPAIWDAYNKATADLTSLGLDDVLVQGVKKEDATVAVVSGPQRTAKFGAPWKDSPKVLDYSSLNMREMSYQGSRFIFVINSAPQAVTGKISNIVTSSTSAQELLGNSSLNLSGNSLTFTLDPYNVKVFKVSE